MLVSHTNKFIFLKSKKTAGTSTESILQKYCIDPSKHNNYNIEHQVNENISEFGIVTKRLKGKTETNMHPHMSPKEVIGVIGEEMFNTYIKICNIRNPYDITTSLYGYQTPTNNHSKQHFKLWLNKKSTIDTLKSNKQIWSLDGEFIFNYIRYENLSNDINNTLKKIGVDEKYDTIPHFKKIKGRLHYSNFYDNESKGIVEDIYNEEITHFKYKFSNEE